MSEVSQDVENELAENAKLKFVNMCIAEDKNPLDRKFACLSPNSRATIRSPCPGVSSNAATNHRRGHAWPPEFGNLETVLQLPPIDWQLGSGVGASNASLFVNAPSLSHCGSQSECPDYGFESELCSTYDLTPTEINSTSGLIEFIGKPSGFNRRSSHSYRLILCSSLTGVDASGQYQEVTPNITGPRSHSLPDIHKRPEDESNIGLSGSKHLDTP